MDPVQLIFLLLIIGVILAVLPMEPKIKQLVIIIVVIGFCLWLISALGIFSYGNYGHGHGFRF
jgi:hypothetical protein